MKNTKQTSKHTAGEWYSNDDGLVLTVVKSAGQAKTICDTNKAFWANRNMSDMAIECQANARLIASAPLMLKALEAVLNMGDDYKAEKLVRKAIKTAKGE